MSSRAEEVVQKGAAKDDAEIKAKVTSGSDGICEPWQVSGTILKRPGTFIEGSDIGLIELQPTDSLYQLIHRLFTESQQESARAGFEDFLDFHIASIKMINNPDLVGLFEKEMQVISKREGNPVFRPKWQHEARADIREKVHTELTKRFIAHYASKQFPHLKFLPLWHATPLKLIPSILKTGFAALSTTDVGYYSKGIYGAADGPEYPLRAYTGGYHQKQDVAKRSALLFCMAGFYNAYPVAGLEDIEALKGKTPHASYDAVFIPVKPRNPFRVLKHDNEDVYFPLEDIADNPTYREFVVTQRSQLLAQCIVDIARTIPKLTSAQDYLALAKKLASDEIITITNGKYKDREVNKQRLLLLTLDEAKLLDAGEEKLIKAEVNYYLGIGQLYKAGARSEMQRRGVKAFGSEAAKESHGYLKAAIEFGYDKADCYAALAQTLRPTQTIQIKDKEYNAKDLLIKAIELELTTNPTLRGAHIDAQGKEPSLLKARAILSNYYVNLARNLKSGEAISIKEPKETGDKEQSLTDKHYNQRELSLKAIAINPGSYYAFDELGKLLLAGEKIHVPSVQFTKDPILGTIKAFGKPDEVISEGTALLDSMGLYLKAIKLNEGYAPAYHHTAELLIEAQAKQDISIPFPVDKRYDAKNLLIKALELDENQVGSYARLSLLIKREDEVRIWSNKEWKEIKYDKRTLAEKALELDEHNPIAYLALAMSLNQDEKVTLKDGTKPDRREILIQTQEAHPNHPEVLFALAQILEKDEKVRIAGTLISDKDILIKAISIKSDFKQAVYLLTSRHGKGVKDVNAKELLSSLIKHYPNDPELWDKLGLALEAGESIVITSERYDQEQLFKKAFQLDSTFQEAYIHLQSKGTLSFETLTQRLKGISQQEIESDPAVSQGFALYVPIKATNLDISKISDYASSAYDLDEAITSFTSSNADNATIKQQAQNRVLLMQANAGSSKSLFGRKLEQKLWSEYSTGKPMPLFISLPQITHLDEDLIAQTLKRKGFDDKVVELLKEQEFFIILDGFDEVPGKPNLIKALAQNYKGKIMVSSRLGFLQDADDKLFKLEGEQNLAKVFITPFSRERIADYIAHYANNPTYNIHNWTSEKYSEVLDKFSELQELAKEPFILQLILQILPNLENKKKVTRFDIYQEFTKSYIKREIEKLKKNGQLKGFSESEAAVIVDDYAKELAFRLWQKGAQVAEWQNKEELFPEQYSEQRGFLRRGSQDLLDEFAEIRDEDYKRFFEGSDKETRRKLKLGQYAAPIKKLGANKFTFLHKSFQEYYVAKKMIDELMQIESEQEFIEFIAASGLNQKHITLNDRSMVRFIVDLIPQSMMASDIPTGVLADDSEFAPDTSLIDKPTSHNKLKQLLFKIVHGSKTFENWSIASANSMTLLNAARVAFSGMDLSHVRIPGAILMNALLHRTNLQDADLTGANLARANLIHCNLSGAKLDSVRFGEYPSLLGHTQSVTSVACSADGAFIVSASEDNTLKIWERESGACLQTLEGHTGLVSSCAFSADGAFIVSGSWDKTLKIWERESGKCLQTLEGHTSSVYSCAFSADGTFIVSASGDGTLKIWERASGRCLQALEGHKYGVTSCAFSADGAFIVSGSWDKTLKIWERASGTCLKTLEGYTCEITSCAFSADGAFIVSASDEDKTLKIWERASGTCLQTLLGHTDMVTSCAFSADGAFIVSGSRDQALKIWERASGTCLQTLDGHTSYVNSCAFSADGAFIVSGSKDMTLKIWERASGTCLQTTLDGHTDVVTSSAFSADGAFIVSGSWDKTLKIWERASGTCLQTLEGHTGVVTSSAFSADGAFIVSGGGERDNTLKIWERASGTCLQTLEGHTRNVYSCAFSADGAFIVSASADETLKIWERASGTCLQTLEGHAGFVNSCAFSADGAFIVSGSNYKTLKIWERASGTCLQTLEGHTGVVTSSAFSADGAFIVSGSNDKTLKIWERASGTCLQTLEGHTSGVNSCAFSTDGAFIVSGSYDKTLKIWERASGTCLQTLEGHTNAVKSCALSADGAFIVSGSDDKTIKYWQRIRDTWVITGELSANESALTCMGAIINEVKGLSTRNQRLMVQRGGIADRAAIESTEQLSLAAVAVPESAAPSTVRSLVIHSGVRPHSQGAESSISRRTITSINDFTEEDYDNAVRELDALAQHLPIPADCLNGARTELALLRARYLRK